MEHLHSSFGNPRELLHWIQEVSVVATGVEMAGSPNACLRNFEIRLSWLSHALSLGQRAQVWNVCRRHCHPTRFSGPLIRDTLHQRNPVISSEICYRWTWNLGC